jgi:hypothetical protein
VIDKVTINEIRYASADVPEKDYTLLFNIVIVAIALLLGTVILLKLKQKK